MVDPVANADIGQATILAGLLVANAAGIIGGYVSVRVQLAVLKENVEYIKEWMKTHNEKLNQSKGE